MPLNVLPETIKMRMVRRVEAGEVEVGRVEAARVEVARVEVTKVEVGRVEVAKVEAQKPDHAKYSAPNQTESSRILKVVPNGFTVLMVLRISRIAQQISTSIPFFVFAIGRKIQCVLPRKTQIV